MNTLIPTKADEEIKACLDGHQSFSVVAGAGSGKTTSLISALGYVRENNGKFLERNDQRIVCITFTNRAVNVIRQKLKFDPLFYVSTLHGFLWDEIKRFTPNIKTVLIEIIIPQLIAKKEEISDGNSQKALAASLKIESLRADLVAIPQLGCFTYGKSQYSNFSAGEIGHDDLGPVDV